MTFAIRAAARPFVLALCALALAGCSSLPSWLGGSEKAKPYTLKTCPVSGEKLGGDMGDPYVFTYQGREIKLCCKDCKKDFDKNPKKYIKKIEEGEKSAKK